MQLFCLISTILLSVCDSKTSNYGGKDSIETSNWDDEAEIRDRLAGYAKEKFSHQYHNWEIEKWRYELEDGTTASKSALVASRDPAPEVEAEKSERVLSKRKKRDGGLISGPIATAVVTGMIGMTAKTVSDLTNFHPQLSQGGCDWFGTAPLCNYPCPADYDYIRANTGRCSSFWFSGFCKPDPSFGKPCTTIFGDYFSKRFCCKSDPSECTWSGRWMGANTAHNIYCRYDNIGTCGSIDCSINHFDLKAQNSTMITGDRCDRLELFGLRGKATCGYIAWFDENNDIVNSWYKTRR